MGSEPGTEPLSNLAGTPFIEVGASVYRLTLFPSYPSTITPKPFNTANAAAANSADLAIASVGFSGTVDASVSLPVTTGGSESLSTGVSGGAGTTAKSTGSGTMAKATGAETGAAATKMGGGVEVAVRMSLLAWAAVSVVFCFAVKKPT